MMHMKIYNETVQKGAGLAAKLVKPFVLVKLLGREENMSLSS